MSEQTVKHLAWKKPVYIAMLVFILQISHVPSLFSAENSAKDDDEAIINIFSPHDTELGRVSKKGVIYNRYNSTLGSVDEEGTIYNISKIIIGKVELDGTVTNQTGTKLGTVNINGEIFNVSARKIGYVKNVNDIRMIGGAARLIFFR